MRTAIGILGMLVVGSLPAHSQTVTVTFNSVPPGLAVSIDGASAVSTPFTHQWAIGSSHSISVPATQGGAGTRHTFLSWSDGGSLSHTITTPPVNTTYTATFSTSYLVARTAAPALGGSVLLVPPSPDGYYPAGSSVQVVASPSPGFTFTQFSGSVGGTANPRSLTVNLPSTVTAGFILNEGTDVSVVTPIAAFRSASGALLVHSRGAAAPMSAGGIFLETPQIAVGTNGDAVVIALDSLRSLWINGVKASNQSFTGWVYAGGNVKGTPGIAIGPGNVAYIAVRDDWNAYWFTTYSTSAGQGPWQFLGGVCETDPILGVAPNGDVYLVAKDQWNALWSGRYIPGQGFQGWRFGGGVVAGKPAIAMGADGAGYLSVRDAWGSLWIGRVAGETWTGWYNGGAVMTGDPWIASRGDGFVVAAILDPTGRLWYRAFQEGAGANWQDWTSANGYAQSIAVAGSGGEFYIAAKTSTGDLKWFRAATNEWTPLNIPGLVTTNLSAGPR